MKNNIDLLIRNAYIVTMNEDREMIEKGYVAVDDGKIIEVSDDVYHNSYKAKKTIDATGKFVFPGFINTHSHLFQNMLKGLGRDKYLLDWLDSSVRRALKGFDEELVYYGALIGCIEAIRTGTTTILDYMYCHGYRGLSDAVIQAFEDVGIRGILGRGYTDTQGFPEEMQVEEYDSEQDFFDDVIRIEKNVRDNPLIDVALAPGIIWDNTSEGYQEIRRIADDLDILITMHLLETADDDAYATEHRGGRTIPYLEEMGLLGPDLIAVHAIKMEDEDFELFKKHDVKISHNPISNMILAAGVAPIPRLLDEGLTVGLATDGSASNDTQNMLEVIKATSLIQKVTHEDAKLMPAATVVEMATLGGAKTLGKEKQLGSIEVGKQADLIIYNARSPFSTPTYDPITALVYSSTPDNIDTNIINGRVVMESGIIKTVDEENAIRRAQKIGDDLIKEIGLGNTQWGQKIQNLGL